MLTPSSMACAPAVGKSAPVVKPSICVDLEPGVGDGGAARCRPRPRRAAAVGVAHAPGSARSRRSRPGCDAGTARSRGLQRRTRGPTTPGGEVLEGDRDARRRARSGASGPSSSRPIMRRSACSSSSTSTSTNGTSSSKPGQERLAHHRPRPHDAATADRHEGEVGSVLWQCEHTMSGGMENVPQREHRATVEHVLGRGVPVRRATARRGPEPAAGVARVTGSPRPPAARRSRPTCTRARAGPARSARRAPAPGAAPGGRSSNCTGTVGSRYDGPPSITDLADVVVGDAPAGRRAAPRPPAPAPTARRCCASSAFHSANVRAGELGRRARRRTPRRARWRGCEVDEARVVDRGRARPISRQKSAPVAVGLEEHRARCGGRPSCGRRRRAGSRTPLAPDIARGCAPWSAESTSDDSVHIAVASSDTSTTEPSPVRVRFEQRGRHAERQRHRAVAVAHRAPLADRVSRSGGVSTCAMPPRAQNADAS